MVLFHKASRVAPLDTPLNTKIEVSFGRSTEDGWEQDYDVTEVLPLDEKSEASELIVDFEIDYSDDTSVPFATDDRELTLKIDVNSIWVHEVAAVKFETLDYPVSRIRRRPYNLTDF